jgi:hypothetical protein
VQRGRRPAPRLGPRPPHPHHRPRPRARRDPQRRSTDPPTPEPPQPPKRPGPDNTGVPAGTKLVPRWRHHRGARRPGHRRRGHHRHGQGQADNVTIRRCRIRPAPPQHQRLPHQARRRRHRPRHRRLRDRRQRPHLRRHRIQGLHRTPLQHPRRGRRPASAQTATSHSKTPGSTTSSASPGGHHGDCVQTSKAAVTHPAQHHRHRHAGPSTPAFIISAQAPVADVLIEGNWLNGGNYTSTSAPTTRASPSPTSRSPRQHVRPPANTAPSQPKATPSISGNVDHRARRSEEPQCPSTAAAKPKATPSNSSATAP